MAKTVKALMIGDVIGQPGMKALVRRTGAPRPLDAARTS